MDIKVLLIILIIIPIPSFLIAQQHVLKITSDSASITNAEFILENKTKDTSGFLFNRGNGRTEFRRALLTVGDKKYLIGGDTLDVSNGTKWGTIGGILSDQADLVNLLAKTYVSVKLLPDSSGFKLIRPDSTSDSLKFYNKSLGAKALSAATRTTLGIVQIGSGLNIDSNGVISTSNSVKKLLIGNQTGTGTLAVNADGGLVGGIANNGNISVDSAASGSLAFGAVDSGSIRSSNKGTFAGGYVNSAAGLLQASGLGSYALGRVSYGTAYPTLVSSITSAGDGTLAIGSSNGGSIKSSGYGSTAQGVSYGLGQIVSSGYGSSASGYASGGGVATNVGGLFSSGVGSFVLGAAGTNSNMAGIINSTSYGSIATGYAAANGTINATGVGSFINGYCSSNGTLTANVQGAKIMGFVQRKASMIASGYGSFISGLATDSLADGSASKVTATNFASFVQGYAGYAGYGSIGYLNSNGRASWATGWAYNGGTITAAADGSYAGGVANGGLIYSGGSGTYSFGYAYPGDSIWAGGNGSYLLGGRLYNTGNYSQLFGYGLRNTANNVFKIGNNIEAFTYDGTAQLIKVGVPLQSSPDVEITDPTKGVILRSPDNSRWRLKVNNDGSLTTVKL